MKISVITAKTLPEAWFLCIRDVLATGYEYKISRGSFAGQYRKEFDYVVIQVEYPGSRPLVPDVPQGVPAPVTQDYVDGYLPYLMTGVKQENEDYTYGEDLEWQIPEVIKMYREDGHNTNQAYMAVGNRNSINLRDPQCLRGIDTRIRYGALHFMVYFRSWDLWGGFPANLAAIQILKEYMASEIGVRDGELIASSKGLHLYDHCWDLAASAVKYSREKE
jgi:thymidylate synthase